MKLPPESERARKTIDFIEQYCHVPEGDLVGKPVVLAEFQKKYIRDIFRDPTKELPRVRRAVLSMAKKNAKTATIAMLVIAFLVGPPAVRNSQIISGAMSREQASIVYNYCCKIINISPKLNGLIRIKSGTKEIVGLMMGTIYKPISSEAKTAHGLSPLVIIFDELGQVRGPRSDFYESLETAQGAYDNAIILIISTQAATDGDLLSIIIDDIKSGNDKAAVCHLYAAPADCDLEDQEAWKAANPALGLFRSERDVATLAAKAKRLPSSEAGFRNLILNQRVETDNPLVTQAIWKACNAQPYPLNELTDIYGGLDLSGRKALTALVLIGWHAESATWNSHPFFWTPKKGLLERAQHDRVPYDLWVKQGYLRTCPGATIDMEEVARDIATICEPLAIQAIAFDRWRIDVLQKEFERIGVTLPLVEHGQGWKDMAPAIDAMEALVLEARLRHGDHPVLASNILNATTIHDPAGNRKLDKRRESARIDGAVALVQACGVSAKRLGAGGDFAGFINAPVSI